MSLSGGGLSQNSDFAKLPLEARAQSRKIRMAFCEIRRAPLLVASALGARPISGGAPCPLSLPVRPALCVRACRVSAFGALAVRRPFSLRSLAVHVRAPARRLGFVWFRGGVVAPLPSALSARFIPAARLILRRPPLARLRAGVVACPLLDRAKARQARQSLATIPRASIPILAAARQNASSMLFAVRGSPFFHRCGHTYSNPDINRISASI